MEKESWGKSNVKKIESPIINPTKDHMTFTYIHNTIIIITFIMTNDKYTMNRKEGHLRYVYL